MPQNSKFHHDYEVDLPPISSAYLPIQNEPLNPVEDNNYLKYTTGDTIGCAIDLTNPTNVTAQSTTVVGNSLNLTAKTATSLFGVHSELTTTLTIEGMTTSARVTIPITLSKNVTNFKTSGDSTDTTVTPSAGI